VQPVRARGRVYWYFRRGKARVRLEGRPGSPEFAVSHDGAMRLYASELIKKMEQHPERGAGEGSVAWVIEQYKTKSDAWAKASESTRTIYDRRHHWLAVNYGREPIAAFDREAVKMLRDLPEFADRKSVADSTVERLAALWDYAEEFLHLDDMKLHRGINPARNIKKLMSGEGESAPLWPLPLCRAFEQIDNADMVAFYHLARFTGQRRSDLVNMAWEHIDPQRDEMFVAQIKSGNRIWVPMPKRLIGYLDTLPKRGPLIVPSPKNLGEPYRQTSVTNEFIKITRDQLGFATTDSKGEPRYYSPQGLRHLCGVELAHAGASDRQIAAVLGHATLKMVQRYVKRAEQRVLARGAVKLRDAMYEAEVLEASIEAAGETGKVRRLRAV